MISLVSRAVNANFKRLRIITVNGKHSRNLYGPTVGRVAKIPPNLDNIQFFGAARRFKCLFGPRAIDLSGGFGGGCFNDQKMWTVLEIRDEFGVDSRYKQENGVEIESYTR